MFRGHLQRHLQGRYHKWSSAHKTATLPPRNFAPVPPELMMVRKGTCDGQTDNPNSDFNVTIQNVARNTPNTSNVTS
ncbi:hypothetical protein SNOG_14314 [Parastagonospora nodorum SN15]|uniref:Uncharacterized protein n=1 Tax=Phaeosphaeria nodorum (strain SN15 / ATCC MYA-4574 / FGSC 10173) TaxID=321614 RepID=Q0U1D8_PHANO|nr:hypothetical protein SNOG_14314 [Parastagonospora nodorum SN15]EAT78185.1 hypothetical protein SNOG_14314 [Parastagonospora nodorum SN15]